VVKGDFWVNKQDLWRNVFPNHALSNFLYSSLAFPHRSKALIEEFAVLLSLISGRLALFATASFLAVPLLAQQAPPAELVSLMQAGAQALHQNHPAEAQRSFAQAAKSWPEVPDAHLGLGMADLKLAQFDGAIAELRRATELNPQLKSAHLFLGIALYQQHEFADSVAALEAEYALQPNNGETLTWLGMAELAAGHPELATAPLDAAAKLHPENPEILDYRGRAHSLVALASFQKLYEIAPDSWQIHRTLAELSDTTHQTQQAIAEYRTAISLKADNPDLYEALGLELQKASQLEEATKSYEKALELNPASATAQLELGKLYVQGEHADKGLPLLRSAMTTAAMAPAAHYYLGMGEAQLGHNAQAVAEYEAALAAAPEPLIGQDAWYALSHLYAKLGRAADAQHAIEEFKKLKAAHPTSPQQK